MSQKVSASASGRGGDFELAAQDIGQPAFVGLDDGAGMMRDQAAQHRVGVLDITQVTGAVQAVQPGTGQFGKVADVVQPRGGFQQHGVRTESGRETARPGGDSLDVGPAAGKRTGQERAGEALRPRRTVAA